MSDLRLAQNLQNLQWLVRYRQDVQINISSSSSDIGCLKLILQKIKLKTLTSSHVPEAFPPADIHYKTMFSDQLSGRSQEFRYTNHHGLLMHGQGQFHHLLQPADQQGQREGEVVGRWPRSSIYCKICN